MSDGEDTHDQPGADEPEAPRDERHVERERWKERVNKLGDIYFSTCRKIASGLNEWSRRRKS